MSNPDAPALDRAGLPGARFLRRIDWLTFLITFAGVWIGYFLTLAPELTLEDSGELAVGSFYAGIPHPPGYPVWTIYTWLWTVLLPIKNVAWRVALAEATSGAVAAGLLGLLVSRGSSLLIEGIEELKSMAGAWEKFICVASGFAAGMLIGYNGFMWSQSVIVEVYSFGVASFMVVLLCLMRWIYAPHQRRWLYLALFFHGVCFTNHQTLIVAAMGLEVAIAAGSFRMGRYLFLGNSLLYIAGLLLKQHHLVTALDANPSVFVIFNVVGIASIAAYVWFTFLSEETFSEFCLDASLASFVVFLALIPTHKLLFAILALGALAMLVKFALATRKFGSEWLVIIVCGLCWILGASLYLYMPLAGMSNPPMQWGYPRTVEGFIHAFTRGQYEKTNPSDIVGDPTRFITQLGMLGTGVIEEFNWVYAFLALVPFLFFFKLHRRERAWLVGITAIYLCLGVLLLILLNPSPDRASQELVRVFFTASHTLVAILIGYGLTLIAAYMATHYQRFRGLGLLGGFFALALAIYSFADITERTFFGETARVPLSNLGSFIVSAFTNKDQYALPAYAGLLLIGIAAVYVVALWFYRNRAPLAITLGLFALMPLYSIMTHWSDNEQRNHWFGYWFGHDMFTPPFADKSGKPLYPEMARNAVLYGGTDPGRFCPTYMIFCDSFVPPSCLPSFDRGFDRRDVYIITQNALADGTYLNYIRAHYNRSTQFDPPFFQELLRSEDERRENATTNALARAVKPLDDYFISLGDRIEKNRRTFTSWFSATDFIDLPRLTARLKPGPQQEQLSQYIFSQLSDETKKAVEQGATPSALTGPLARDLNQLLEREIIATETLAAKRAEKAGLVAELLKGKPSRANESRLQALEKEIAALSSVGPLYEPRRFQNVQLSEYVRNFIKQDPRSHTRIRLNRLLLESAYPAEIARSKGGVYPDREIHIATPQESMKCFEEYMTDATRRMQLNQLKPGEDVRPDPASGRVQVSGQVSVMAINGLLTKVMFDQNPGNEFFVEESYPLDWMYPHLSPFGIIMKINREPVAELTEDVVRRDHDFWSQYSTRLIGNWITYDTTIEDIAKFVEKVYLRRDFSGFSGDRKFIRDDQAQKAFSKLRSAIGGVYAWRVANCKPGSAEHQRMLKEAEFAFRQSFAFCPYSPEAVFRYAQLLASLRRVDDALLLATTCQKLDPYSAQIAGLIDNLRAWKREAGGAGSSLPHGTIQQLEELYAKNHDDFAAAFNLASACLQLGQTARSLEILDAALNNPHADSGVYRALLQAYTSINNPAGLNATVEKLSAYWKAHPTDFFAAATLAEGYRQLKKDDLARQTLDQALKRPELDSKGALEIGQQYAAMLNYEGLEATLEKLVKLVPGQAEAWYDLAALKAALGKNAEALPALRQACELSASRLLVKPSSKDLRAEAAKDPRFNALLQNPEFKKIVGLN